MSREPDVRLGANHVNLGYSKQVTSPAMIRPRPTVLEFFAGIGLARLGLEAAGFEVIWSNDYEAAKHSMYAAHFKDEKPYVVGDVGTIDSAEIPQSAAIAWASSPCTDLSLAGTRAGLAGRESSAFWSWLNVLRGMNEGIPPVVVLENVTGLATSHGGDDLRAAIRGLNALGYSVDAMVLDARRFLPQSRPRLFLVGLQDPPPDHEMSGEDLDLRPEWLQTFYSDPSLKMHRANLPTPPAFLTHGLSTIIETMESSDERWWDRSRTEAMVASLSAIQLERVRMLRKSPGVRYRTAYRRTRNSRPTWEIRADDISGCLRTARGGSSKQAVVQLGNGRLRARWMTPIEYARLMGAGNYDMNGARTSQALFAFGDAVAVPAVQWLGENYLRPHLEQTLGSHSFADLASSASTR